MRKMKISLWPWRFVIHGTHIFIIIKLIPMLREREGEARKKTTNDKFSVRHGELDSNNPYHLKLLFCIRYVLLNTRRQWNNGKSFSVLYFNMGTQWKIKINKESRREFVCIWTRQNILNEMKDQVQLNNIVRDYSYPYSLIWSKVQMWQSDRGPITNHLLTFEM